MARDRIVEPDLRAIARRIGIFVGAIGAVALAGWVLDVPALDRIVPGFGAMAPNTAVAFLALAAALISGARSTFPNARPPLAALALLLLGLLTGLEYLTGRDLHIDQVLFPDTGGQILTRNPSRMAISTAVCLMLLGAALILLRGRRPIPGQVLAGLSGLLALLAIAGLIYEMPALYSIAFFQGVAANTAMGLALASFGAICVRPDAGAAAIAASPTLAGLMFRRLVTITLFAPLLVGWLRRLAENAGLFPNEFGDAAFTVAMMFGAFAIIGWLTGVLARVERAQRADAEAIGRLAAIVESSDDGIMATDREGRITAWNRGAERIYGYAARDVIGRHLEMLAPVERAEELREIFQRARSGENIARLETVRRRRNGSLVPLSITVSSIKGDTGEVTGTCAVFRDVTESRRAQEALSESEERYRNLFVGAHDIVFTLGVDGRFTSINPAAERVFGYPLRDAVELRFEDVVPPDDRARIRELFEARSAGNTAPAARELEILARDGRRVAVEVSTQPVFAGNRVVGIQGIGREISERRKVEARRRDAERTAALASMVAGVAHEVRNPLFAISATVEALRLRADRPLDLGALSEALAPPIRRLNDLMNGLIEYVRPSVVDAELEVAEIFADISEASAALARPGEISLSFSCAPEANRSVRVDRRRFNLALRALIENAARHEPPGGSICIEARIVRIADREMVRFSVDDRGPGFTAAALEHALDPFYTERSGTAGLGLAIARRIVDDHDGRIAIENRPAGGARVVVDLPPAPPAPEAEAEGSPAARARRISAPGPAVSAD